MKLRYTAFVLSFLFLFPHLRLGLGAAKTPGQKDKEIEEMTLDIMLKSLKGKDSLMKQKIIRRIAILNDKEAISPLVLIFLDDKEDNDTRREAAKGAIALGGEINYAPIIKILDGRQFDCLEIIRSLMEISDRRFIDPLIKYSALPHVKKYCSEEAAKAYIRLSGTEDKSVDLKQLVGTRGEVTLVKIADKYEGFYEISSINILGALRAKSANNAITKKLSSKNNDVKVAAIRALARINEKKSIANIGELLRRDVSLNIKDECIKALISMGGSEAFDRIEKFYRKSTMQMKSFILRSLNSIKSDPATRLSERFLGNETPADRKKLKEMIRNDIWS